MNVVRSQTEETSIEELRAKHQAALDRATATGVIPTAFEGDPTFRDAVRKRRKAAANSDRPCSAA